MDRVLLYQEVACWISRCLLVYPSGRGGGSWSYGVLVFDFSVLAQLRQQRMRICDWVGTRQRRKEKRTELAKSPLKPKYGEVRGRIRYDL